MENMPGVDNLVSACIFGISRKLFEEEKNVRWNWPFLLTLRDPIIKIYCPTFLLDPDTVNSIKPYRSVKPRRFFSMGSFPRQSSQTKVFTLCVFSIFFLLILSLRVSGVYLLCNTKKKYIFKYFCLATLSCERTDKEKFTRFLASLRFNGIHCIWVLKKRWDIFKESPPTHKKKQKNNWRIEKMSWKIACFWEIP